MHNDVLQGNFIDDAKNDSYKSIMAWKWYTENNINARFVLKTKETVFVDSVNLNIILYCSEQFFKLHKLVIFCNNIKPNCLNDYALMSNDLVRSLFYKSFEVHPDPNTTELSYFGSVIKLIDNVRFEQLNYLDKYLNKTSDQNKESYFKFISNDEITFKNSNLFFEDTKSKIMDGSNKQILTRLTKKKPFSE